MDYEELIARVNEQFGELTPPGLQADRPCRPVLWVVGIPRSGSTLLSQLLAETGAFGYPTNLVARFWHNPAYGLRIQQVLEPVLERGPMRYASNRGRTEQWFAPHEFGYFWERHLPFEETHRPSADKLEAVDWSRLTRRIAELEAGWERPLFFKNLTLSLVVDALARQFPNARFLEIRRDPEAVANSLYRSRLADFDDPEAWFSIRPAEVDQLRNRDPVGQVVGQMEAVERHLRSVESDLHARRWMQLDYREICEAPADAIGRVQAFAGLERTGLERLPESFESAGARAASPEIGQAVSAALAESALFELEEQ